MRGRADILVRHAEPVYCLCMDKSRHLGYCSLIGVKGSSSEKRKKKMAQVEIRRHYGLYIVYVDGVKVETFTMLYMAKEFVAKVSA